MVRLIYKLRSEQIDQIDGTFLHRELSKAHSYTIQPELVSQLARPRLPELGASNSIDPMEALKTYLNNREDLKDISGPMLEAAHKLLTNETVEVWSDPTGLESTDRQSQLSPGNAEGQLRLL